MSQARGKLVITVPTADSKSPYKEILAVCRDSGVIERDELTEKGLLLLIDRLLETLTITYPEAP